MKIPKPALNIIDKLNEVSYEAYFVGGCVRDMLMGKEPKDWDITTSATPDKIKSLFKKTIDTGIKHGTVTVLISGEAYEVTTYRVDGKYADFRHPDEVIFTSDLKEDLVRRDFTVNAIAYHPQEGYIDFFGGREDIEAKIIRGVGNPAKRFNEDALRMLRAIRFSCQLGFDIEGETFTALCENSELIAHISMERIRDELIKSFTAEYVEKCEYFIPCKILNKALPFLSDYLDDNLTEFINCLKNLKKSERCSINILSLLFRNLEEGTVVRHLREMKIDNTATRTISFVSQEINGEILPNPYNVKKIIAKVGVENYFKVLSCKAALGEDVSGIREIAENALKRNEPIFIKDLDINGNIIMERLLVSGVKIGEILNILRDEVMKDPTKNNEASLLEIAKGII
ncbi:MAG: CCA tRNA nucleotidyltransferase [Defluviitaleaceae bacterium]|nr:CCA tRNA nucleotidyltransferase [Defluviitaleaceae bacterium]